MPPSPITDVMVEEVAKGIWYLTGGSHHSILVEFADHFALIEAPLNEARTLAVIAKAKEIKPDKPLRYLVNTHHHFDHSGGIRAAIAEGLTIVTQEANKQLYEEIAGRKHTIVEDALAKNPKPLQVQTVKDKHVMMDATRTMEIYHIAGNPHADTLLMIYFLPNASWYRAICTARQIRALLHRRVSLLFRIRSRTSRRRICGSIRCCRFTAEKCLSRR